MYTVFLHGLEFYAYHGVPDAEQQVGHRYVVDLDLVVNGKAPQTDSVNDTVDYGAIGKAVLELSANQQHRTVERLAQRIADDLLARFSAISSLRVRLAKRLPPAPMLANEAGVVLVVDRT